MAKILVALSTAVAIGTAALVNPAPAKAQSWVAPVVVGSVIAGGIVGAAIAASPYYQPGCCYSGTRGLFTSYYSNCGCAPYGYAYPYNYSSYAYPYYNERYAYGGGYAYPSYRPYVAPYYRRYAYPYRRHAYRYAQPYYRGHQHPYVRQYHRAGYRY